ncbi:glycerate kinase type-2 family protein [Sulfuriflexus mobilis]|uniref:glycerate kinase type-2 family protein n=1 Tax=Sulfuriflexus mobilis TaxID=1811807 RepID=UPI001E4205A9|nr:DUF4147 domain-containing protein [Sulfuriflexus mobilis]
MSRHRQNLLNIFNHALLAVNGRHCVATALREAPVNGPVVVIAIGKAAASMARGAEEVLGEQITDGLVITKYGHTGACRLTCLEAAHPVPDENSLVAGQALLDCLARNPQATTFLFLISGGASALVEVLPEGMDSGDLARINDWLLGSGLDIARMNRVRKSVSMIKGGRLATYLAGRATVGLLISDVIGDDPAVIGSGLLAATPADIMGLADINLPGWFSALSELAGPMPAASDPCFETIRLNVIASLNMACSAAAHKADALGYDVFLHPDLFCCDAESTGVRLATAVMRGANILHIWGGETVVELPAQPGRGGRNQHLALAAAISLQGHPDCLLLAAATDGTDGPTPDAGALVDGETLARGELSGVNAQACLQAFDAGSFLEASGDLINTGPTGTNVMDIVLGLKTH